MMQSGDWRPEHSEALRDYVNRGVSFARAAAEINARFGTAYTRNAALGRGKRMGLVVPIRDVERPKPATIAPRPAKSRERRGVEARPREPGSPPAPPASPASPAAPAAPAPAQLRCVGISPRLVALVELEPGDCRYPYG